VPRQDQILQILSQGPPSFSEDYRVSSQLSSGKLVQLAIGHSATGNPACLLMGIDGGLPRGVRTHALEAKTLRNAVVCLGGKQTHTDVVAVECLSPELLWEFASLVADFRARVDALREDGEVLRVLRRWQSLFSSGAGVDRKIELGLWGELWVLAHASDPDACLRAWRGPEGGTADFLLDGVALEVKTTTRPGVHHLSQTQAELSSAGGLLSLSTERDPSGLSCKDLLRSVASEPESLGSLVGRLGEREAKCIGSLDAERYALTRLPALFALDDVPRVRGFDLGVRNLRYEVTLDFEKALDDVAAGALLNPFGLGDLLSKN